MDCKKKERGQVEMWCAVYLAVSIQLAVSVVREMMQDGRT
jgi:hypothetical protein